MTENTRTIEQVGVIGLGTMGAGIVEVFAKAGLAVVAVDGTTELAERGRGFLEKSTGKQVQRGRMTEADQAELLGRVTFTAELRDLAAADLVVEAVPERLDIKREIFGTLDGIVSDQAILASNTSSLSLTEIAAGTKHPHRVVGMHFFNPAPVLKLVEVITTILTDDDVVTSVRDLATQMGKKPVVVGDRAGFVANALLITYLARAIRTYETGHVTREDLDAAGRVGIGLPMGPLTLCDLIGLDVAKEVCGVLYNATHDPSAAPPALLEQMVAAGRLGRKTGQGFYDYGEQADDGSPAGDVVTADSVEALATALSGDGVTVELHQGGDNGRLAEVVRTAAADQATIDRARASLLAAEVTPVVGRDRAGRVRDALLLPHLNDAVKMLDSGYASAEDIDTAMTAGCGYPRGPLQIIDDLGADRVLEGLRAMAAETGEPALHPSPLLVEHAAAGRPFRG
ncbi:3-hydroxyacyl-CoA dehydrogenase [Demetria terragena]|uniref:3-hydroxyacyl-CoA dehydrogenase n=1 Tax=Demetria terragena TaxID=63959 RepID=UPI0003662CA9|nr:3-hydroxybutyryl-CoA dehydrogenase [Demetria terragena]